MTSKASDEQIAAALTSLRSASSARDRDAAAIMLAPIVRHLVRGSARRAADHDLDDLYQLALVAVVRSAELFDGERSPWPWLQVVVARSVSSSRAILARQHRVWNFSDLDIVGDERCDDTPEQIIADERELDARLGAERREDARRLAIVVRDQLSNLERQAYGIVVIGGQSYLEAAQATGSTLKQIDNAISRARHKLDRWQRIERLRAA